jgi:hypothetical protein
VYIITISIIKVAKDVPQVCASPVETCRTATEVSEKETNPTELTAAQVAVPQLLTDRTLAELAPTSPTPTSRAPKQMSWLFENTAHVCDLVDEVKNKKKCE